MLNTVYNSWTCNGYFFKKDKEYIVYAHKQKDGTLGTELCSRTAELVMAQEDLEVLGEGNLPTNSGSYSVPQTSNFVQILSIVGVLLVIIGIIVLVVKRYKK